MNQPGKEYDIPPHVGQGNHSRAFATFLQHYFVDSRGLMRREIDLQFLDNLTEQERTLAKELIRRNLTLRYSHIIDGVAALRDREAIPELKNMLTSEEDLSLRLTIAGVLWMLDRDGVFVECLQQMVKSDDRYLKEAHIHQVAWLNDERAIDLLIELLDDDGSFVRFLAVSMLNTIEFKQHFHVAEEKLPRNAEDYRRRRRDPGFREMMMRNLTGWYNANTV